uniref:type III-B CRISPR module RAMP protein Cmr6 n=1 Tax=Prevotella heparinolytica TaxID=28113 RepID=UPI0035A05199
YKSIYNRDIFFDAVIVRADKKGRILCSDSITPHGDNPLKNPTPLTFLKIAPGCTMEFRFKLVNSEIDGQKFTAAQKKALFEEIIQTVGIGAKTNVGYGQFQ